MSERDRTWEISPLLLSVISLVDGRFTRVNPSWPATLGWAREEIEGAAFADFLHPADLEASREEFSRVQAGKPVVNFRNRYRHKDGSYRWLSWVAVPEDDKLYSTARDVTADQHQALELAARTAERDRLWRTSQDLLAVLDLNAVFQDVSAAAMRILGFAPEEMIGQCAFDLIHPDDIDMAAQALATAKEGDLPTTEVRFKHKDGGYRWLAWVASPSGELIYGSGRHVTAEREAAAALAEAQEALRQSQKLEAIGQLTGGVAHDFNNLLTVIRGSAELLKRPGLTEDKRERYLAAISDTADRAATLTGQLLAFARRQTLKPTAFDVRDSIAGIAQMLGTLLGSRVTTQIDLPDEACTVSADANQFDTSIVNMAANARDAMDGAGMLTIDVRRVRTIPALRSHAAVEGDYVAICITDTGAGIAHDDMARVFEPFFTTKNVGEGTGLGLSQVFGFAKQSGGEVRVESIPGEGTTFVLYLPRTQQQTPAASQEAAPAVDGRGVCVLIVEDNEDVGAFAKDSLGELGYEAILTGDGRSALAELANHPGRHHVVFSDVVMPGMSGIELAQEVRRLYPRLPVVLTSGYSHVLAQNGTFGFELLHKPYSLEQLSQAIAKAAAWGQGAGRGG